jgi:hypothetical protein
MGWIKGFVTNLILILASIAIVIVGVETILHFTKFKYVIKIDDYVRYYYKADDIKGYDIVPNVKSILTQNDYVVEFEMWSNELGCFDEPYKGEKEYILMVGDSFTHAYVPFPHLWGTQIEKLLKFRVLKCGVSGYGTKQELFKAKEIISKVKHSPRLIIVGYFWNDLEDDYVFPGSTVIDGYIVLTKVIKNRQTGETFVRRDLEEQYKNWKRYGHEPPSLKAQITHWLKRHSVIAALIFPFYTRNLNPWNKGIKDQSKGKWPLVFLEYPWLKEAWANHLNNFKLFKQLAIDNQAELLIVIIPTKQQVYGFLRNWQDIDPEKPNKIVHEFFKKEQIRYIDLLPAFKKYANQEPRRNLDPEKDFFYRYDGHWNSKGERLAALLVSQYIIVNGILQVAEPEITARVINQKLKEFQ